MSEEKNEVMMKSGFAALSTQNMEGLMDEDLNGLTITPDRIKIPSGGSTAFEVPGDGDDSEMVKEITGVILFHHPAYAYYKEKYAGGSNPPDCGSFDGITGVGIPGGACATCPYNQFGSGEGQSKLCKNRRQIYILPENELFPMVLSLPTGSLKEFTKYVKHQLTKGRKLSQIVTKLSLKKATSSSGIVFSQAVFTYVRPLTSEEQAAVAPLVQQAKEYSTRLTVDALTEDVSSADAGSDVPFIDPDTGEEIQPLK
jgi:hypothetical protein